MFIQKRYLSFLFCLKYFKKLNTFKIKIVFDKIEFIFQKTPLSILNKGTFQQFLLTTRNESLILFFLKIHCNAQTGDKYNNIRKVYNYNRNFYLKYLRILIHYIIEFFVIIANNNAEQIQIQKFNMLQRHQKNDLDQLVAFARDQLQRDFLALKSTDFRSVNLISTANTVLNMYSNLSYPFIGLQVIKQNMTKIKHPHSFQIQMVFDKAQLFYLQSVKHDLNKLKQDQRIQHIALQDIKEYIQQINWKLGFDKESILNQSQQIGDNIDLMKFFEGVRNYQNWEENLQKKTIEKLKKFANQTQNQLTLRKGFLISKIQHICYVQQRNKKQQFLMKIRRNNKMFNKLLIFTKILQRAQRQTLNLLTIVTRSKNTTQRLKQIFKNLSDRSRKAEIILNLKRFTKLLTNTKRIEKVIKAIVDKKRMQHQIALFKIISTKKFNKCQRLGRAIQKLSKVTKKLSIKQLIKMKGIYYFPICRILDNIEVKKKSEIFSWISQYAQYRKALKVNLSDKMKGKILLSIHRHENKPINIRKTFLNWYLKGHQQKYAKMIYNIWLNGSISKFAFLMRIKNCLNESKKQKVPQQLKIFLMIFMQKMNGYYNYCQKSYITKWRDRFRYCKKLQFFANKLEQKVKKINNQRMKQSFETIIRVSKNKKYLIKYFTKRINSKQISTKLGFDTWKTIPNIKKLKAQRRLLGFLRQKFNQIQSDNKQIFEIFRQNQIIGHSKKLKFVTKVFTKDLVYTANFFNIWRRNVRTNIMETQQSLQKSNILKSTALKDIASQLKRFQTTNKKQTILKFLQRAKFSKRRHQFGVKVFQGIFDRSESTTLRESYDQFKNSFVVGKRKKQKLVYDLVIANKMKQGESLSIWKTVADLQKQYQKKQRIHKVFDHINYLLKQQLSQLKSNRPIHYYVQKMKNNYQFNVYSFLEKLKRLPPRINWNKRKNSLDLVNKLNYFVNRNKLSSYEKFKLNFDQGQFKKKKIMSFMSYQYIDCTKNYFKLYLNNVRQIKINDKHNIVTKVFQTWLDTQKNNFDTLFIGDKLWRKKQENFNKFNKKIQDRVRQALKLWQSTARSMTLLNTIKDQKKKRLLGIISQMLDKNEYSQTKKCINLFSKNSKIIQLQTNFLKKLCDSQAGKVIKAMMIWKNLPQPKNKELIAKASKFESNLHNYAFKVLRASLNRFKDQHYFGNDRKKLAIRKLVATSCSGIQKYFSLWKKNNHMTTLFSQCHKVEYFMETLLNISSRNNSLLYEGDRSKKIQGSFNNIQKWWNKHSIRIINIWRNKIKAINNDDNKKRQNIRSLVNVNKEIQQRYILDILLKIKKQLHLKKVFSKYFVQRKKNNLHQSILKIIDLPNRMQKMKKNEKVKSVLRFLDKLNQQVRVDRFKVLQYFRQNRTRGNYKKIKSCDGYLKDKISEVHKILTLWNEMSKAAKLKRKQQYVKNLFSSSFQICKSNIAQILSSTKQTQIKKRCFEKLFSALDIKKKGLFNIWKSKVKQIKMNQMLDKANKKAILQKINKLVAGTSTQTVKKTLKNFYTNYKISQVQVKFIQRLLQTKSGKVLEAFNKWKKIPNQNLMQKYKKGQKFFFKLEGLIKKKLTQTHKCFIQNEQQGSTVKKQSVLQLLQITSSGIRRYYNRWIRITKRDHTLLQANSMMHSLDAMNNCLVETFKILFEDQRSSRIKTWAIEKLILASNQSAGMYLHKWKQNVRQQKMKEQFEKKQKTTALQMFSRVLGGSQSVQIKQIIQKFHKNLAISKISKNFLNRLLKTKSGKVVQLFELWKSIPDVKIAKKKKKAIKFESNLNKIFLRFMKKGYQPFKNQSHQARNKKRICIQRLIRASMGEEKKKFILWRQIIKQDKMLHHTHLFDSMFEKLNQNLSNSLMVLIKNTGQQVSKKKNLCRKLINNSNFVQHHAYFIWKEALQTDNIKIQKEQSKVKANLINLININEKVEHRKLIQIISLFKKKQNFRNQLASDIVKQQKNKKAIVFYNKMFDYSKQKIGSFLYQLIKSHRQMICIRKNNSIQKSFQNMKNIFAENLNIMMRSNRQTVILQKALNRIFANFGVSTQRAFNLWRQYKNILALQSKISDQKKKKVIQLLTRSLKNQQAIKIPYVIERFQKNYKSIKLRKQILTKILQCKAGKVPLAFMLWKSLPNPGAKKLKQKAMKFQSGLARLIAKKMRITYQKFKQDNYEGNNKKKYAVRKLILVTMSDSNRCFNKWRKVSNQAKITQKVTALSKIFEMSNDTLKQNVTIFTNSRQQIQIKENCIKKLINNTNMNLLFIIQGWKNRITDNKCYVTQKILEKFQPQNRNNKLIKQSFNKIKNKADMQVLRTYINSLWKWKMSNVQANYYAKFIKVFKQSQQLLILSNVLNKKNYQNMHYAFKNIICYGTDRHNRKQRITQKYLTRKISNYFQRFKLNACFQEIKTWRNMYKQVAKGKKLMDLLQRYGRKLLYQSLTAIQQTGRQLKNAQKFDTKINKVKSLFTKQAFLNIYKFGYEKFAEKVKDAQQNIILRLEGQCFNVLKTVFKVQKIQQKIGKTLQKFLKKYAFSKIHFKAHLKSKYKIAINLISCMQLQNLRFKSLTAITGFKKRATKLSVLRNIANLIQNKRSDNQKYFYQIIRDNLDKKLLLNRFKKGTMVKKILEKQNNKALRNIFQRLRKKQNKWVQDSIRKYIIRSNIKSSVAVSLWRFKNYQSAQFN